jgi:hypothetical protein
MPIEYLTYLNIVLLSRLVYLVRDRSLTMPGNAILTATQLALCAAVFQWGVALWAMLLCVVIFTGLGWFVERPTAERGHTRWKNSPLAFWLAGKSGLGTGGIFPAAPNP